MGIKSFFSRKKKSSLSLQFPPQSATPLSQCRSPVVSSGPEISELEEVFKKFDVNGDGKISSSELASIMRNLGHPASEEEAKNMIAEVDRDGDGFIDLAEFIELNTNGVDSEEELSNLKDAFSVYDIDGNGSITAEELQEVMRSLGEECSMADCQLMIKGVDRDGDGLISFDEFKVMMGISAEIVV